MGNIPLEHGLIVATILFALGFYGVMVRRNLLFMLMSLEIMMNAAALAFVLAGSAWVQPDGQIMFILILTLAAIQDVAPDAGFRVHGLKVAREPRRYSGRTSMRAPLNVHEPKQPTDIDSALTFSMEGYVGNQTPSPLVPFAWSAGWNSPQAWNKFQDNVGGHLKGGDSGVRLFERLSKRPARTFVAPAVIVANPESFRLVPMHHIFASGEFTVKTPAMESRIPEAVFAVGEQDATRLNVQDGQKITVKSGETSIVLQFYHRFHHLDVDAASEMRG